MSKAVPDGIRLFFEEFCQRLQSSGQQEQNRCGFTKMLSLDRSGLLLLLGDLGERINGFVGSIDKEHPEAPRCHGGLLGDESEFPRVLEDLLSSLSHAQQTNNSTAEEILRRQSRAYIEERFPEVCRIDLPERNRCHVRMVSDRSKIECIRGQKKTQLIMMESVCKKGQGHFDSHPDNFQRFMRFDQSLSAELERLECKAKRYEQIGCIAMASEMRNTLMPYHDHVKNTYYGFNRITMSVASIVLARNIGFRSGSTSPYHDCDIQIGRDYLGGHGLPADSQEYIDYEPAIYPLCDMEQQMTANMKSVVETLDRFPEAGGKPIFDFFGVIVPSVKLRYCDGFVGFVDDNGSQRLFQNYMDCKSEFDKFMVKMGLFRPVLVAEKDHKCYFVTHWL